MKTPAIKRRVLRIGALGAIATMALSGVATAGTTADHNNTVDQVRGTGSDTTYFAMQKVADLYNGSPGCSLTEASGGFTGCPTDGAITSENHDHDEIQNGFPTGSGNGIKGVCGSLSTPVALKVDYGRSSRNKSSSDCAGLTFRGFAKDALVPITFPSSGAVKPAAGVTNLTKAQLITIFNGPCSGGGSITNWNQVGGGNAVMRKWGVQTGSGTYTAFKDFLGGLDPNACAQADGGASRIIFENNAQQIAALSTADELGASIHWFSHGRFTVAPFTRAGGAETKIDGIQATTATIAGGTFPATRVLWNVFKTATASQATKTFVEWSCKSTHAIDPETGDNYNTEISSAVASAGFLRLGATTSPTAACPTDAT